MLEIQSSSLSNFHCRKYQTTSVTFTKGDEIQAGDRSFSLKTPDWAGGGTYLSPGHSGAANPVPVVLPVRTAAPLSGDRQCRAGRRQGRAFRRGPGGGAHGQGLPPPPPRRWFRPAVVRPARAVPGAGGGPVLEGLARAPLSYNLAGAHTPRPFRGAGRTMAVGKNKRLTKGGKKGAKKKV